MKIPRSPIAVPPRARPSRRAGLAIPLAVLCLFVLGVFLFNAVTFSRNQDFKAFHSANVEKARHIAESALESANLRIRREMNIADRDAWKMVSKMISELANPKASWFWKFRVPGILVDAGFEGQTGLRDTKVTATLSVSDIPGIPKDWGKGVLVADSSRDELGLAEVLKAVGGRADVKVTSIFKHLRPITSEHEPMVLWEGAVTDDSKIQQAVSNVGTKLFGFLGLPRRIEIDLSGIAGELSIDTPIPGLTIPLGQILGDMFRNIARFDIDISKWVDKAIAKLAGSINIGDLLPVKANVLIEKIGTLEHTVEVDYYPEGSRIPFRTKVVATRDMKVVDLQAPNPLYTFYWLNKEDIRHSDVDWAKTGGGLFVCNNLTFDIFKPDSIRDLEHPGLIGIGGSKKQVIPTSYNDVLMIFPRHSPLIPKFPSYGFSRGKWYMPSGYRIVPCDIFIPNMVGMNNLCVGWIELAGFIYKVISSGFIPAKTQFFGNWGLHPTLNLTINGNVYKQICKVQTMGVNTPWLFLAFVTIPGFAPYLYTMEEYPYGYSFYEQGPAPEGSYAVENIYKHDQYMKKATYVYKSTQEFMADRAIRDDNGVVFIDGVLYVDGPLELSGKFYGAGQIVCRGDLTITGDVRHTFVENDRKMPFSLISLGTLRCNRKSVVEGAVYAADGVEITAPLTIDGNFVCRKFTPKGIAKDFKINYRSRNTTASLLALIPVVGRYAPDRYRAVMSQQYTSWKVVKLD